MFNIVKSKLFDKKSKKITKNNPKLAVKIANVVDSLQVNPLFPSLGSHKVNTPKFGQCFSSRVTGDVRIIWQYDNENRLEILELLDLGGDDTVY